MTTPPTGDVTCVHAWEPAPPLQAEGPAADSCALLLGRARRREKHSEGSKPTRTKDTPSVVSVTAGRSGNCCSRTETSRGNLSLVLKSKDFWEAPESVDVDQTE